MVVMSRLILYVLGGCSLLYLGTTAACNFAPGLWCTSRKIASICGVEDQCQKYLWSKESNPYLLSLSVFYETLCSDTQDFIIDQLWPAWTSLHHIINLTLVPYGKAFEHQTKYGWWNFTCQHGKEECTGNTIQTCAIHTVNNITKTFPFVYCMEKSRELPVSSYTQCAKRYNINPVKVDECAHSYHGNQLQHQMAMLTYDLDPPMNFVPWITLNGVHTDDIQERALTNLHQLLCDAYKGPRVPECH